MKRLFSLASIFLLVFTLSLPAGAAESRIVSPKIILSFDGSTACCKATITSPGDSISATMTLKKGTTVFGTWSDSANTVVFLEGCCSIEKRGTYVLEVTGTAGDVPFFLTESKSY